MEWILVVSLIAFAVGIGLAVAAAGIKMPMVSEVRGFPGTPMDHDPLHDDDGANRLVAAVHDVLDRIDGNGTTFPYDQDLEMYG